MATDYTSVTEAPDTRVTQEAIDMVCTRYAFAADFCTGKAVLELACGPGAGLGRLKGAASRLVGGDYTQGLLGLAKTQYGNRVPLVRLDAHELPFARSSFEVIVLFEAIYFLADAGRVLDACYEVLAPHGIVIVASANPARPDFNPSPKSTRYFTGDELVLLLRKHGFAADLYAGFPIVSQGAKSRLLQTLQRIAVTLHLMPKTMAGKELLKRLMLGKLVKFPADVTVAAGTTVSPVSITNPAGADAFKVIYAVARKGAKA